MTQTQTWKDTKRKNTVPNVLIRKPNLSFIPIYHSGIIFYLHSCYDYYGFNSLSFNSISIQKRLIANIFINHLIFKNE